jgi:hypothetical protein
MSYLCYSNKVPDSGTTGEAGEAGKAGKDLQCFLIAMFFDGTWF